MRIVSAYTVGTPYEQIVKTLRLSIKKYVPFHYVLVPMASRGNWTRNCQIKPDALLSVMEDYADDVLWVDADAEFLANPIDIRQELIGADFGCHFLPRAMPELLSGTLYFNKTNRARRLLDSWRRLCSNEPGTWDQKLLQRLVEADPKLNVAKLQPKWCWVDKISEKMFPDIKDPVIYHHQASRRFR